MQHCTACYQNIVFIVQLLLEPRIISQLHKISWFFFTAATLFLDIKDICMAYSIAFHIQVLRERISHPLKDECNESAKAIVQV